MQPPRQKAGDGGIVHLPAIFLGAVDEDSAALGIENDFGRQQRPRLASHKRRIPFSMASGPSKILLASTRSAFFGGQGNRENSASPTTVEGTPTFSASITVHLPVPFWPATSRILGNQRLAVFFELRISK